jgi:DNA-binding response OmpR family regulator
MTEPTATPPVPPARVLVVDDEESVRAALARSLTLLRYSVDVAASGRQALEMLERTPYDVMLLDMRMPGMGGIEVMQRAGRMCSDLSIIVLTGHATLESAIAAVKSGAIDYLLKPASIHELATAVSKALQRHAERLRRQRLLRVLEQVLEEARRTEGPGTSTGTPPASTPDQFLGAGPIVLDRESGLIVVAGVGDAGDLSAELTVCEAKLLAYMMQHPDAVLSCRELARSALGYDVTEREAQGIVRPHISRLRKKIEPGSSSLHLIRTIFGHGYRFDP